MFMQQYATEWGSLMAAATATMVPAFIFFLSCKNTWSKAVSTAA